MAAELGMSGEGNDEEIVKLSIEGKVRIGNKKIFRSNSQLDSRENHQVLLIDGNINLDKMKICNRPLRDHHCDRCKRPLREKMETRQSLVSRRRSEKSPPSEVIFD